MTILQCYVLGDRLLTPDFKRSANSEFAIWQFNNISEIHLLDFYDLVSFAFEHIPENRPILQLLVDVFCHRWGQLEYVKNEALGMEEVEGELQLPDNFKRRVMYKLMELNWGRRGIGVDYTIAI